MCFALTGEVVKTTPETKRPGIWSCSICTYDNDENMSACDICGVLRAPLLNNNNANKKTGR